MGARRARAPCQLGARSCTQSHAYNGWHVDIGACACRPAASIARSHPLTTARSLHSTVTVHHTHQWNRHPSLPRRPGHPVLPGYTPLLCPGLLWWTSIRHDDERAVSSPKLRKIGRAPPDLAPTPRAAIGESGAQALDLGRVEIVAKRKREILLLVAKCCWLLLARDKGRGL